MILKHVHIRCDYIVLRTSITAKLNSFETEDQKESVFKVVMDIIDGIYHFIFHS